MKKSCLNFDEHIMHQSISNHFVIINYVISQNYRPAVFYSQRTLYMYHNVKFDFLFLRNSIVQLYDFRFFAAIAVSEIDNVVDERNVQMILVFL